jgi:hypothetical protein
MNAQMHAITALTLINTLLLVIILVINLRSYLRMRAQYTLFVLLFTGLFLLQNLVSGYYFLTMMSYYVPEVTTHILILSICQTLAFSTLLWMQRQ